jgi:hypothetical protein
VPCASTPGPEGSTCSVDTTADAITPNLVREGKRMVWELNRVALRESYNGSLGGLVVVQGLFVP